MKKKIVIESVTLKGKAMWKVDAHVGKKNMLWVEIIKVLSGTIEDIASRMILNNKKEVKKKHG